MPDCRNGYTVYGILSPRIGKKLTAVLTLPVLDITFTCTVRFLRIMMNKFSPYGYGFSVLRINGHSVEYICIPCLPAKEVVTILFQFRKMCPLRTFLVA